MRNLAENLNTELFVRERYSVRLTEQGRRLYATVKPFLDELGSVAEQIRRERDTSATFVLYCDPSTTDSVLMPALPEIRSRWPELDIKIICSDISVTEANEPVSLGLQANLWKDTEGFDVVTICSDLVFPVCAPDNELLTAQRGAEFNLEGATMLHLEQTGRTWVDWHEFCRRNTVAYPSVCEETMFTNYPALLDAVVQGYGVGLAWERSIRRRLEDGSLRRLGDTEFPWPYGVCAYLPKRTHHDPVARELVDWLLARFSRDDEPHEGLGSN